MHYIIRLFITALALLGAAYLIPGIVVTNISSALIAAVVLSLLNTIVRPLLVILTLPITILTLGLFIFVINALLFWFAASFLDGFAVSGFLPALIGSLFVSVVSAVAHKFIE